MSPYCAANLGGVILKGPELNISYYCMSSYCGSGRCHVKRSLIKYFILCPLTVQQIWAVSRKKVPYQSGICILSYTYNMEGNPTVEQFFVDSDSDSDSSPKHSDSGIDSDSGIGIVHHWYGSNPGQ